MSFIRMCVICLFLCPLGFTSAALAQTRHAHGVDHWFASERDALTQTENRYGELIEATEQTKGIPKGILIAQIQVESSGNARAPGGLLQISKVAKHAIKVTCNTAQPECGIEAGAEYLCYLHNAFHLSWAQAVTAYNKGPGCVTRIRRTCSDTYCKKVSKIAALEGTTLEDN